MEPDPAAGGTGTFSMLYGKSVRLVVSMLVMLAVSGCLFGGTPKHLKPLSEESKALLAEKGLKAGAAMFVRVFKEDSTLEVWMKNDGGTYTQFKSYNICNWSGELGPKVKEGDKQAPEGFYVVAPAQMNPKSNYHLAFNIGYPNAYDTALGRTGKHLMVHGGCRSAGCYAMTDEAVQEIYALARDAFLGGQREFPVHAFPFRLTDANLALRQGEKWYDFWRNLKQGYDQFEKNRRPPLVGVSQKRYVFFDSEDAVPPSFQTFASMSRADPSRPVLISRSN
jgi:murein L,D-transpeptidase YafK